MYLHKLYVFYHPNDRVDWNGRRCLEQTQADATKNQADNTKRLSIREQEVHRWKCELERAIAAAAEEISFIEDQRRRLKQASSVLQMPESIGNYYWLRYSCVCTNFA